MGLERKKTMNVFREATQAFGSYDEFPVGPKGTDPMPHLSRNRVAQPFYSVCAADQVLIQMAGQGELWFAETEASSMRLGPGDTVYIPAGVPSRVVPDGEVVQIRLKAEPPAKEAVAWYCGSCRALVHGVELDEAPVQRGWARAVAAFNGDEKLRTCACGAIHPAVALGDIAWLDAAAAIEADS